MAEQEEKVSIKTSQMHKGRMTIWHLQQMKDRGEKIVQFSPGNMDPMFALWAELGGVEVCRYVAPSGTESFQPDEANMIRWTEQIRMYAKNIHLNAFIDTHLVPSNERALDYCSRIICAGADSVLIMGITNDKLKFLADNYVPVFGHVGALSGWQTTNYGGYKRIGKTAEEAYKVWRMAYEYQENGMKAMTVELVPEEVAQVISENLSVPVIGIAAGAPCDGSELVIWDMFGMMPNPGVHAKVYLELPKLCAGAFGQFAQEVKTGVYPQPENGFTMDPEELAKFKDMVDKDKASV